MLSRPRALPDHAHIAVLAASGASERARIEAAARRIEQRGHRVTIVDNVDHRYRHYLAGSDDERAEQLNAALRDDRYDAFFFARGGYGAMRILDRIDYEAMRANPRPLVGFSDVTAIHQALATQANVASFHGPMLNLDFYDALSQEHEEWLWRLLRGDAPLTYGFGRENVLYDGEIEGELFGGCLSLTAALTGTPYDYWPDGGIWFFEEVDEAVYRVDRMLTHLRLSGRMQRIRGVVIGKLKGCGGEAEMLELLRDFFEPLRIPVVHNLPFGHYGDNLAMPIGSTVRLDTRALAFTIAEAVVAQ
ncbi:MAG TPA: LD-carboxypeptidase [Thermoanaerobaculia bacterium]|nr:LD-carboxypeptidase [Thermoanaerobaculia bacterium]